MECLLQFEQIDLAVEKPDILTGLLLNNSGAITGDSKMKHIILTRNKFAIVDDDKFEWLNQWKWCALKGVHTYYAVCYQGKNFVYMHRLILNAQKGQDTDHRNHNGLDNRIENIRLCTQSQNLANSRKRKNCSSKYKGVHYFKRARKWTAQIRFKQKQIHLGYFNSEIEAAKAYDKKAIKVFGEFARINFPVKEQRQGQGALFPKEF